MNASPMKTALLAAASLIAAAAVGLPAAQAALAPPIAIEHVATPADHDPETSISPLNAERLGFAAAATTALAGLMRLIGVKRLKAAGAAAGRAAVASVEFAASAGKAVIRAAASPFRFAMVFAGIGVASLAGVGIYDIEWAGGLVFGVLISTAVIVGARRVRRAFAYVRLSRR